MTREDVEQSLQRMYAIGYKKGYKDALKKNKGEWIITYPNGKYNPVYECPKCKASNISVFKNFCPNCGADMRGANV